MGDRSNIVIESNTYERNDEGKTVKSDTERVYLYAHWSGSDVIESAIHGLESGRGDDPAYLARIIFQHMIRDDGESETGFGISASEQDNEHPIIVINADEQRVSIEGGTSPIVNVTYADFLTAAKACELNYEKLIEALKH